MSLRNIDAKATATNGRTESGRLNVLYRTGKGSYRAATVLGGGTGLSTPTGLGAAAVGSGGTFAAGSYFWKVTAIAGNGETNGSNEATATLVLNGSATLTWTAVTGATGYKIYRGTATGAENALVGTVGQVTTFTDTGAAGSGATPPASNNSANGLRLQLQDSGIILNNVPKGPGAGTYYTRF